MRRGRRRFAFEAPSLVPLADMLSNTVGVMVFIFIFTVVAAGGALVLKTLPLERSPDRPFEIVVCSGERVLPLDREALLSELLQPLGEPTPDTMGQWLEQLLQRRLEREDVEVSEEIGPGGLVFILKPHSARGETAKALQRPRSRFRAFLGRFAPKERFVYFIVYPDGLHAFKEARSVALETGFATGWMPMKANEPIRFGNVGLRPGPQNGGG